MRTCPANVWNHTSACACTPATGNTLTAEAPEIDLTGIESGIESGMATSLSEPTCEWCLGTGVKQDPWNPEITHPCACQTVRAPSTHVGWSASEPDYEQIAEDRAWARGGGRVERDEWGGLDIPS